MKGTLHKTEQGWIVEYAKHSELPLHPDDESLWMFAELNEEWKDKLDGKEVEFEIVSDTYEKPGKGNTYAKLIPSKEQQKQLITEIMDLDAKDGLYDTVNDTGSELDKLAEKHVESLGFITFTNDYSNERRSSFIYGYNKAKETLYTEEQVREAINLARVKTDKEYYAKPMLRYSPDEIIQSLKQPKKD
jgi:hypothetical protein